jgi:hypothetical protein
MNWKIWIKYAGICRVSEFCQRRMSEALVGLYVERVEE